MVKQLERPALDAGLIAHWNDVAVNVTPELAQLWLAKTAKNRSLSDTHVERLSRSLVQGDWVPTNDAITFNDAGELTNGQHRLTAISVTGKAAPCLVVRGIGMEALDTGRKRSVADGLGISGFDSPMILSPALAFLWRYENHIRSGMNPTLAEAKRLLKENAELPESVPYGWGVRAILSAGKGTFVHYMASRRNKDKADEFLGRLADGVSLGPTSPILVLRNRLIGHKAGETLLHRDEIMDLAIKAWNLFELGQECRVLRVNKSESPVRFRDV